MTYVPVFITIDFSELIYSYPYRLQQLVEGERLFMAIRSFLEKFTVQDVIQAVSSIERDLPYEQSSLIWPWIESKFPDGLPEIFDDTAMLEMLNFVIEDITHLTDRRVDQVLANSRISHEFEEYLFTNWISPTSAVFVNSRHKYNIYRP